MEFDREILMHKSIAEFLEVQSVLTEVKLTYRKDCCLCPNHTQGYREIRLCKQDQPRLEQTTCECFFFTFIVPCIIIIFPK